MRFSLMRRGRPGPRPAPGDLRSLVVRAWLEPGAQPELRVRVIEIAVDREDRPVLATTSADEACLAVRRWLETRPDRGSRGNHGRRCGDGLVTHPAAKFFRGEVAGSRINDDPAPSRG